MELTLVGLDGSGKTSFAKLIAGVPFDEAAPSPHTAGFKLNKIQLGKSSIKIWDVGGLPKYRPMWIRYCRNVKNIIFMVDSADEARIKEASIELKQLLSNPELNKVPILIIGNKRDLPNSLNETELIARMELDEVTDRMICLFMMSNKNPDDASKALEWLARGRYNINDNSLICKRN